MDQSIERWRPVPAWESFYEVSDHGRVRTVPRWVRAGGGQRRIPERILRPSCPAHGYQQVIFTRSVPANERRTFLVHLLVVRTFRGERPEGYECDHVDGNRCNNHLSNLQWVTVQENNDRKNASLQGNTKGEQNPHARLTAEAVLDIRQRRGEPRSAVAADHDIRPGTVTDIWKRRSWAHL
jgi:hypothetical protein